MNYAQQCQSGTHCNITCDPCYAGTTIDGTSSSFLTVHCIGCYSTVTINCPNDGCNVTFDYSTGTVINYDGVVEDKGIINILSTSDWHSYITVSAVYIYEINLFLGDSGIYSSNIQVDYASSVLLFAHGYNAFRDSTLNAQYAESVTIHCSHNVTACRYSDYYLPSNAKIQCYGHGCKILEDLYISGGAQDLSFSLNACGECSDKLDCLSRLGIKCDEGTETYASYSDPCDSTCGCSTLITSMRYTNKPDDENCYAPGPAIEQFDRRNSTRIIIAAVIAVLVLCVCCCICKKRQMNRMQRGEIVPTKQVNDNEVISAPRTWQLDNVDPGSAPTDQMFLHTAGAMIQPVNIVPSAPSNQMVSHTAGAMMQRVNVVPSAPSADEDDEDAPPAYLDVNDEGGAGTQGGGGEDGHGVGDTVYSDDLNMNANELLVYWGFGKYVKTMIDDEGWNDPMDWNHLTENDLKNDIGFNNAQTRKFMGKHQDWLKRKNMQ